MKELRNRWTKVDDVNLSMYTGDKMSEKAHWAFKREYSFGLVNVGTPCNEKCFYCSQYWNPPDLVVSYGGWLTMEEIKHFLTFVPDKVIRVIGYGHHVNNGEFFAHPKSLEILEYLIDNDFIVRGIDTNGHSLTENHIKFIERFHTKVAEHRHYGIWQGLYLHLTNYEKTKDTLELLSKYKIPYVAVIVISTVDVKNGRTEKWIEQLQTHNPTELEVVPPGYTKYTPEHITKHMEISWEQHWGYMKNWRRKFPKIPIEWEASKLYNGMAEEEITYSLKWLYKSRANTDKEILFLVAESVGGIFESIVEKENLFTNYKVVVVKNETFGGSIKVSGLLQTSDYISILDKTISKEYRPDLVVLPKMSFFYDDLDLRGVSAHTITEKFNIPVVWC